MGDDFSVTAVGIKPYPCCRSTHAAIATALKLKQSDPQLAERVRHVHAIVPKGVYERCGAPFALGDDPRLSAQFSIPFTMALALRGGAPTLEDFAPAVVIAKSSRHADLIRRIEVEPDRDASSDLLTPVAATFDTGEQKVSIRVDHVPGGAEFPPSSEDQITKLNNAAASRLDQSARDDLLELCTLRTGDSAQLMKRLREL